MPAWAALQRSNQENKCGVPSGRCGGQSGVTVVLFLQRVSKSVGAKSGTQTAMFMDDRYGQQQPLEGHWSMGLTALLFL